MAKTVDANIIIRFLVGDRPDKVRKIKRFFQDKNEKLILTDVTVAEIIWVLSSYYEQSREEITEEILSLIELPIIISNKTLITKTLSYFREYNIDYIDAYLIAFTKDTDGEGILSYDKSIDRIQDIKRYEP